MSEATRTAALSHAVATHGPVGDYSVVLTSAEAFHAFILKDAGPAPKASTPARAPAAAAEGKPAPAAAAAPTPAQKLAAQKAATAKAAAAKAAAAAAASAEDTAAEEGTAEGGELDPNSLEAVEAIIADMLSANARKKAVALLAEYNAKSASGVPEESRAEFIEKAQNILLGA
jgi:hypothetical protein